MSNLIQLQNGSKAYGAKNLFQKATFAVNASEHIGVIGPNGAGKTTLFRILTDEEELDEGEIVRAKGLRLGYLAQHDRWGEKETVEDYLSSGCITPIWELKSLGRGLGLTDEIFSQPIVSLSGGYRMRCKLLHLLGEEPDLLLLDEPTNYLDLESLVVLENFLQGYKGAFLLISHDREFLRRTTDHILEVEAGDIIKYNGNLDDYFEQKALLRDQLEARAQSLEEKRRQILDFVNRFGAKATKARQAQSRLKSLAKMETIEIKELPARARIQLPDPVRTGRVILEINDASLGYGDHVVLQNVNFQVERGHHLAVVGVNGAGKSTLLKAMAGHLRPLHGEVSNGSGVTIGYFAQHVSEALDPEQTVLEAIADRAHPSVLPQQVLNLAGSLLFSNDDVQKKVAVLSGGEKSRVALGQILLQKSPCLILDEPTNHLDFQTVEALTSALREYTGTIITVSHDRSFIRRVADRILEVRDGRVDLYPGTYDEYVWSLQRGMLAGRIAAAGDEPLAEQVDQAREGPDSKSGGGNFKDQRKSLERELRQLEKRLAEVNSELSASQAEMNQLNENLINHPNHPEFRNWMNQLADVQARLESSEESWLTLEEQREKASRSLEALLQRHGATRT